MIGVAVGDFFEEKQDSTIIPKETIIKIKGRKKDERQYS
jgi:hypothetical protein